jgi:hypothetical protein
MIEILGNDEWDAPVFVHKHLLCDRSAYLKTCIRTGREVHEGRPIVRLNISNGACDKLVQWVYGKPMLAEEFDGEGDPELWELVEIHDISLGGDDDSSKWDTECIAACLEASKELLDRGQSLENPLQTLQSVLQKRDNHSGRDTILAQLVLDGCNFDGGTLWWLRNYWEGAKEGQYGADAELMAEIGMEFAEKVHNEWMVAHPP